MKNKIMEKKILDPSSWTKNIKPDISKDKTITVDYLQNIMGAIDDPKISYNLEQLWEAYYQTMRRDNKDAFGLKISHDTSRIITILKNNKNSLLDKNRQHTINRHNKSRQRITNGGISSKKRNTKKRNTKKKKIGGHLTRLPTIDQTHPFVVRNPGVPVYSLPTNQQLEILINSCMQSPTRLYLNYPITEWQKLQENLFAQTTTPPLQIWGMQNPALGMRVTAGAAGSAWTIDQPEMVCLLGTMAKFQEFKVLINLEYQTHDIEENVWNYFNTRQDFGGGFHYYHVNVPDMQSFTVDQCLELLQIFENHSNVKSITHCLAGFGRTGAVMLLVTRFCLAISGNWPLNTQLPISIENWNNFAAWINSWMPNGLVNAVVNCTIGHEIIKRDDPFHYNVLLERMNTIQISVAKYILTKPSLLLQYQDKLQNPPPFVNNPCRFFLPNLSAAPAAQALAPAAQAPAPAQVLAPGGPNWGPPTVTAAPAAQAPQGPGWGPHTVPAAPAAPGTMHQAPGGPGWNDRRGGTTVPEQSVTELSVFGYEVEYNNGFYIGAWNNQVIRQIGLP